MKDFQFLYPKSINKRLEDLKTRSASYWEKMAEKQVLELANFILQRVPAYQRFLKDNGIDIKTVHSLDQLKLLPRMNKNNYLRKYHYPDLFPEKYFERITTFAATSGSTGEPFYFPRGENQDQQYEYIAELFLKNQFGIDKKRALGIIGFGLGIWIGGIFTYKNFNRLAQKGYPLALAPAGTNKQIFLETFKKMAGYFDQVILMGYPPFIKDIIDEGSDYKINWSDYQIKIITAAEGFSENFRNYLAKKTGITNQYTDILNIYGTVELGTMAHETPLAVLIRKLLIKHPKAYRDILPGAKLLPTLAQYHPNIVFFEAINGEVVGSGFGSTIPLVRYQFFDKGGVITFDTMVAKLKQHDIDIFDECRKAEIDKTVMKLPFVYIYERSDFVIILRGANIFPENIKNALQKEKLERYVTGKFTMIKQEDNKLDEYLEIHVELKKTVKPDEDKRSLIETGILNFLLHNNSEFSNAFHAEGGKVTPRVILHFYEDPKYFLPGTKQKWVKKS